MVAATSLIFYVFMSFGIGGTLLIFFMLPLETTGFGLKGGIPSRINNFLTVFTPVCIAIAMIAYWLR